MARLTPAPGVPGLAVRRRAAAAILWAEQLWPAIWPATGLAGAFLAAALLDLPALLPPWFRLALPVLVLLAMLALLWRGLARIARPTPGAVDRRLERDSGLAHRPLAALADRPATPGPEAAALWALHQARLRAQLRFRTRRPRPGLARRDVFALRGLLLVALAAALAVAGPDAPQRILSALAPGLPQGPAAPGTLVQAWAAPPAYTGLPPIFLKPGAAPAPIPAGAHLTIGVTGGSGTPSLDLAGRREDLTALDAASWQGERDLAAPGQLTIRRGSQVLAEWTLPVLPDHPPTITFTAPPGPAVVNRRPTLRTRFAWSAEDDYGVATATAELTLQDRPGAAPLVIKMPVTGNPKQPRGASVQDLTAHPWAGLPVIARMVATDAPGQRGQSEPAPFTLPERPFQNPLARALIEVRKQLSRNPDDRRGPRAALDALAEHPDLFADQSVVLLQLHGVASLLRWGEGQPAVDEAQARLWSLALSLEEVSPERTAQALEQARQAMRDALERAQQNPEDKQAQAELQKRIEELREAIQRHAEALMDQARREGAESPFDPNQPQMDPRQLDRMAQDMEKAAREGRMDDARQQMAELEKQLEQLQNARPEHGERREQRNAERRQQGRQQQNAVQDMVQREGTLLDHSRTRADQPARPPQGQQPPNPRDRDQRAQLAMRRALGELMQRFGDLTGKIPDALGEADTAMRDAGQAMAAGHDDEAQQQEQKAIEALQKGGRQMGQQLARQFGRGPQPGEGQDGQEGQEMGQGQDDGQDDGMADGSDGTGDDATANADGSTQGQRPGDRGHRSARRDPLGRDMPQDLDGREQGVDGTALGTAPVPTEMEQARTRALQDELRRRGADRTRPQEELDYIDRLLKSY